MDVTDVFKASVATQRKRLELKTPASEILPPTRKRHAFTTDALSSLQSIRTVQSFLQDSHAAYMLDDILEGMSEAERDDVDAEASGVLKACGEGVDRLRQAASAAGDAAGEQLRLHRQAMLQLLQERLREAITLFDTHRNYRLQRAQQERDARLGAAAAAAAAGSSSSGAAGARASSGSPAVLSSRAQAAAELDEYADALSDEELDAGERAQLQEENALLFGQMNTMANEAEQRMADIAAMSSQLSHYLHEQDEAIGEIRKDLDVTNDNLQTGNAYLDSAARHSRDFRIFILTFLLVASFSLLFLDWYYD